MAQAKQGGEYGVNGEWYNGGEFLPSSPLTIKGEFTKSQIKSQKAQARQAIIETNEVINSFMAEAYPGKTAAQARELYAKYLKDNGVNIYKINIYSTDLINWI